MMKSKTLPNYHQIDACMNCAYCKISGSYQCDYHRGIIRYSVQADAICDLYFPAFNKESYCKRLFEGGEVRI